MRALTMEELEFVSGGWNNYDDLTGQTAIDSFSNFDFSTLDGGPVIVTGNRPFRRGGPNVVTVYCDDLIGGCNFTKAGLSNQDFCNLLRDVQSEYSRKQMVGEITGVAGVAIGVVGGVAEIPTAGASTVLMVGGGAIVAEGGAMVAYANYMQRRMDIALASYGC